jgi:predicted nucleic acid-binding Zn ribbon protein
MSLDPHTGRKKEAAPLELAFQELLKTYRLEEKFKEKLLVLSWPDLVGKTIADRTGSIFIREKKMFVKINSGPIKKELQLSKSKVLQLIEERVGKSIIEDLVFI